MKRLAIGQLAKAKPTQGKANRGSGRIEEESFSPFFLSDHEISCSHAITLVLCLPSCALWFDVDFVLFGELPIANCSSRVHFIPSEFFSRDLQTGNSVGA
jgi:hypothetical protein